MPVCYETMSVCLCVYFVSVYTYLCVFTYVSVYTHLCVYSCVYTYLCVFTYVTVYTHLCVCLCELYACLCVFM